MEYIIWFSASFIIIYIFYYFIVIRNSNRKEKVPSEAQLLITRYRLDTKKFSYRKFLKLVGLVCSFDIAIVSTIVACVKNIIFQLLFGFIIVIPVVIISYTLLGKYYSKKQLKDNSRELAKEKKFLDKKKKAKKGKKRKEDKND